MRYIIIGSVGAALLIVLWVGGTIAVVAWFVRKLSEAEDD
jgi:hypothetical protein